MPIAAKAMEGRPTKVSRSSPNAPVTIAGGWKGFSRPHVGVHAARAGRAVERARSDQENSFVQIPHTAFLIGENAFFGWGETSKTLDFKGFGARGEFRG